MNRFSTFRLLCIAIFLLIAAPAAAALPLTFVPNQGQTREDILFTAQGAGFRFAFMQRQAVFAFSGHALALRFVGANPDVMPEGNRPGLAKVNYFLGNDPTRWRAGVGTYDEVVYRDLWPGIDLLFRGAEGQLKYEFVVSPGAHVSDIKLAYDGSDGLSLDRDGGLRIRTSIGVLTDGRPVSFQIIDGKRVPVESRYRLTRGRSYTFKVARHDRRHPLVIDPGLVYSTYLGGVRSDFGNAIAVGSTPNAYVTGATASSNFPLTPGAFDSSMTGPVGMPDVFVTKLNADGSGIEYSTFIGGRHIEIPWSIAVDAAGNAYVTGETLSADFPTTPGAYDTSLNGFEGFLSDIFVTKLNPTGSALVYSSFLGSPGDETDFALAIAIDASGNAYLTGGTSSAAFPTTAGAYDTTHGGGSEIIVVKLNAAGSDLVYSTFLGNDLGRALAVDSSANAYIVGGGFVRKLNPAGSALVYSTRVGGAQGIAVDAAGQAYVVGVGGSSFLTTPGAFQETLHGSSDAFVMKLNATGSDRVYATLVGGSSSEIATGIAIDSTGNAYVAGATDSTDFPTTPDAFDSTHNGEDDIFVIKVNGDGSALTYSSYFGGTLADNGLRGGGMIAVDSAGGTYVTGLTPSSDFPTTPGAFQTSFNGPPYDAFALKLDLGAPAVPASLTLSPAAFTNVVGTSHTVTATVQTATGDPVEGVTVDFTVTGSVSASGSCTTASNGMCTFTYTGSALPGSDVIVATAGALTATATKTWIPPASTPGCKVTMGGKITAANGDKATFGNTEYTDHGPAAPMKVKWTSTQSVVCTTTSATLFGQAGTFTFRIDVKDLGEPGSTDTYRIRLSNGYDSGEQVLTGGNIQIR